MVISKIIVNVNFDQCDIVSYIIRVIVKLNVELLDGDCVWLSCSVH